MNHYYPTWFVTDAMVEAARVQAPQMKAADVRRMLTAAMVYAPEPSRFPIDGSPVFYDGDRIMLDVHVHMHALFAYAADGPDRYVNSGALHLDRWIAQGGAEPDWAAWGGLSRDDLTGADRVARVRAACRRLTCPGSK